MFPQRLLKIKIHLQRTMLENIKYFSKMNIETSFFYTSYFKVKLNNINMIITKSFDTSCSY